MERVYFPEKSSQVPDRPALTLVVLAPEQSMEDERRRSQLVEAMTQRARLVGPDVQERPGLVRAGQRPGPARRGPEAAGLGGHPGRGGPAAARRRPEAPARRERQEGRSATCEECVWRTYKHLLLLGKDNTLQAQGPGPGPLQRGRATW